MWKPLHELLTSPSSSDAIKMHTVWVIGTAVQNNPSAQNAVSNIYIPWLSILSLTNLCDTVLVPDHLPLARSSCSTVVLVEFVSDEIQSRLRSLRPTQAQPACCRRIRRSRGLDLSAQCHRRSVYFSAIPIPQNLILDASPKIPTSRSGERPCS